MLARHSRPRSSRGLTLVELVAASAVMAILAAITLPVAGTMVKRQKELELRRNLRTIREAINRFHDDVERYPGMRQKLNAVNEDGYPEELEQLYEGFDIGDLKGTKLKYLRRLPRDPITGKADWGTRSSRDRPGSTFSDGINVFDVYSKSDKIALDGTPYATW